MREQASLGNFCIFTLKKLLFLSIFCWYFRNFVGTNDIHVLVGLHVYRQISKCANKSPKKHYGGGGQLPPAPSGYASGEGGGGGKESSSFGVIENGTPQRGGCGDLFF